MKASISTIRYISALLLVVFSSFSVTLSPVVFAAARTSPFTAGQTLDPGAESVEPCGPTDANCFPTAFTTDDEGIRLSSNILHLNFVGAGVTATHSGATTTVTISGGGSGLSSLNGLTNSTQTFATTSDANIAFTITSTGSTHTFTPSWTGILAVSRGGTGLATISSGSVLLGNGSGQLATTSRGDITTGTGLSISSGSGSNAVLGTGLTLDLDINALSAKTSVSNTNDYVAVYDASLPGIRKVTRGNFLQGLTSAMQYQGTWNANTNSPSLSDGVGIAGQVYAVSVASSTVNLGSGNLGVVAGDLLIYNGSVWQRAPSGSNVTSVFGRTGAIATSSGDYRGADVAFTPTGTLSSTNVQSAIGELLNETMSSLNGQTGATQTFADDTNVTITSSANVHTLGWTGTLALLRGGTGLSTIGAGEVLLGNYAGNGYQKLATSSLGISIADTRGVLSLSRGGTGTSTAPTYGQILLGNAGGTYDLVSTSSLGIVLDGNFSSTSAIYLIHSSTTIAKTYTQNSFSALQTFSNSSTTLASSDYSSSTVAHIGSLNASQGSFGSTTIAATTTTTGLSASYADIFSTFITNIVATFARITNATIGTLTNATATIYDGTIGALTATSTANFYQTANVATLVATSSLSSNVRSDLASTTAYGRLITGNVVATSSAASTFAGAVGIGTSTPSANLVINGTTGQNLFQIATSTNQSILVVNSNGALGLGTSSNIYGGALTAGLTLNNALVLASSTALSTSTYALYNNNGALYWNGTAVGTALTGAVGQVAYFSGANTASGTSTIYISPTTQIGIGTSTFATTTDKLAVSGSISNLIPFGGSTSMGQIASVSVGAGALGVTVSGRYAYVANATANTVSVVDVSNPSSPVQVGTAAVDTSPQRIVVAGKYAYVNSLSSASVSVIDVSNPSSPVQVASTSVGGLPIGIALYGHYLYAANSGSSNISIIDVANPLLPVSVNTVSVSTQPRAIAISGRYAFVSVGNTVVVLDLSSPTSPVQVGTAAVGTTPRDIVISGRYAYVVNNGSNNVSIVDIANPASPIVVATSTVGTAPFHAQAQGRYLYVTNGTSNTVSVVDISSSTNPVNLTTMAVGTGPRGIAVSGRYAYVANSTSNSLSVVDISGAEFSSVLANSLEAGNIQSRTDITAQGNITAGTSLFVGSGGILSNGGLAVTGTTSSYIAGALGIGTTTNIYGGALTAGLTLNNALVLASSTALSTTTYALYNVNGTLYWNGTAVGTGSGVSNAATTTVNFTANGAIGAAVTSVDNFNTILIPQTTSDIALSLPNPTAVVTGTTTGKIITVTNTGSVSFMMYTTQVSPSSPSAQFVWTGSAWNPIGGTSNVASEFGEQLLGTNVTIGAANTSSSNTISVLSFTLPSAGTWEIVSVVKGSASAAGRNINFGVYDATPTLVANSEVTVDSFGGASGTVSGTGITRVTTTGPATYQIRAWDTSASGAAVIVSDSAGRTKVTWQKISGNSAVTGQTVDYLQVARTGSDQTSIVSGTDIIHNTISAGNIPYNTSTGVITLSAGKTYRFSFTPSWTTFSNSTAGYIGYALVDATTNTQLSQTVGDLPLTYTTAAQNDTKVLDFVYTATTNQTVKLRTVYANGSVSLRAWATGTTPGSSMIITQLGTSAITSDSIVAQGGNTLSSTGTTLAVGTLNNNALTLISSSTEMMRFLTTGQTLIGTTTPTSATLFLAGTSTAPTRDLFTIASSTGAALFNIRASGNVGIGTTTPTANLVINGTTGQNLFQVATSTNQGVLVLTSTGALALGTSTPTSFVHIASPIGTDGVFTLQASGASYAYTSYKNGNTGDPNADRFDIGVGPLVDNRYFLWGVGNRSIDFGTNNLQRVRIGSDGRFEVGTTSASAAFNFQAIATSTAIFRIASSTGANVLTIGASGNLGIGTTTANANLVINGTTGQNLFQVASSTNQNILVLTSNGALGLGTSTPTFNTPGAFSLAGSLYVGGTATSTFENGVSANTAQFGGSAGLYVGTSGRIGIGTTSAFRPLTIEGAGGWRVINPGTNDGIELARQNTNIWGLNSVGSASTLAIGVPAAPLNIAVGTTTASWLLNPYSATAPQLVLSAGGGIAQWALRNAGGNLYFATTTTSGTATTSTSALTILNNGNVGIGTSTTALSSLLTVDGTITSTAFSIQGTAQNNSISFSGAGGAAGIHTDGSNLYVGANNGNIFFRPQGHTNSTVQPNIDIQGNLVGFASLSVSTSTLTTGSLLSATTNSASLNSTNGLLYVANTGPSTSGYIASLVASSTTGYGLYVKNNGSVSVGTTTSTYDLEVSGGQGSNVMRIGPTGTSDGVFQMIQGSGLNVMSLRNAGGNGYLNTQNSGTLFLGASTVSTSGSITNQIALAADGRITAGGGNVQGAGNLFNISSSTMSGTANLLAISTTTLGNILTVQANGNVGIGATNPGSSGTATAYAKLYVDGNIALRGQTGGGSWRDQNILFGGDATGYALNFRSVNNLGASSSPIMSLLDHGRVGIGTVAPGANLDVTGLSTGAANSVVFRVASSTGTNALTVLGNGLVTVGTQATTSNQNLFMVTPSTGSGVGIGWNASGGGGETDFFNYSGLGAGGYRFYNHIAPGTAIPSNSAATLLMSINYDGKVGIGTTTPTGHLSISGTNTTLNVYETGTNSQGWLSKFTDRMALTSTNDLVLYAGATDNTNGNGIRIASSTGNVGINVVNPSYRLDLTDSRANDYVARFVNTNNSAGAQGVIIQAGSNSLINSYMMRFLRPDTTEIGKIVQDSLTTVSYTATSDRREKDNIVTTTHGLSDLMNLQVADFNFKKDSSKKKMTGFIAQDLYLVFPDAVVTNGDNGLTPLNASSSPWSVDYGRVTPLLARAIQEQQVLLGGFASSTVTSTTGVLSAIPGLHSIIDDVQAEVAPNVIDIFVAKITSGTRFLTDFVTAKIVAIRGYFDEVWTNRSHTKELCVGDKATEGETCIKKTDLDKILSNMSQPQTASVVSSGSPVLSTTTVNHPTNTPVSTTTSATSINTTVTQSIVTTDSTASTTTSISSTTTESIVTTDSTASTTTTVQTGEATTTAATSSEVTTQPIVSEPAPTVTTDVVQTPEPAPAQEPSPVTNTTPEPQPVAESAPAPVPTSDATATQ